MGFLVFSTPSWVKWASSANKMLRIIRELELIQRYNSSRLHMSAGSRCWMRWMDWSWWCTELAPRSPDLNPLDYYMWGYVKAMVYVHKVNMREELLQRILSAARSINNAAVLRKVTSFLVTRVRKCIQAGGGHFEQCAWVLNGESETVRLTT
jgi:hypothetical protein